MTNPTDTPQDSGQHIDHAQPYVEELKEILHNLGWRWHQEHSSNTDHPDLYTFVRKHILAKTPQDSGNSVLRAEVKRIATEYWGIEDYKDIVDELEAALALWDSGKIEEPPVTADGSQSKGNLTSNESPSV